MYNRLETINHLRSDLKKFVFFITGASGVGKSTLANHLKSIYANRPDIAIFGFDSIGVPCVEEMSKAYGSPSEWQRAATKQWIAKILYEVSEPVVILEGQVNLDFIYEAFEHYNFVQFKVILIDCSVEEMIRRLIHDRVQPELANENMRTWRIFLRKQSEERRVPVIDTGSMSIEAAVQELQKIVENEIDWIDAAN